MLQLDLRQFGAIWLVHSIWFALAAFVAVPNPSTGLELQPVDLALTHGKFSVT